MLRQNTVIMHRLLGVMIHLLLGGIVSAQCTHTMIIDHMAQGDTAIARSINQELNAAKASRHPAGGSYTIPVVLHVFHDGDRGRLSMDQLESGLQVLNDDFNGRSEEWNNITPRWDSIKASIDIEFCLATIDPSGNHSTGVNYYDIPELTYGARNLYQYGWDNTMYLNIYLPIYVFDSISNFTAFATYPSITNVINGRDGVHYSSIRWGYGSQSQLTPGQDWASVVTHEVGHWLSLRHTFEGGCLGVGDGVADTPPTAGGTIYLSACDNNNGSCGESTNGSNYMDYNHDCKRMFTAGQVDRMITTLNSPPRKEMWSESNLIATGCQAPVSVSAATMAKPLTLYPNPSSGIIQLSEVVDRAEVYTHYGKHVVTLLDTDRLVIDRPGTYMIRLQSGSHYTTSKAIVVD